MKVLKGKGTVNKKLKHIPKFIIIKEASSPIAWFRNLVGKKYEVLDISPYDYIKICYDTELELYGWLPLNCCKPHLSLVKKVCKE